MIFAIVQIKLNRAKIKVFFSRNLYPVSNSYCNSAFI